jgi:hypothetical protein
MAREARVMDTCANWGDLGASVASRCDREEREAEGHEGWELNGLGYSLCQELPYILGLVKVKLYKL